MEFWDGRQLTGGNIGSDWLLLPALQKLSKRVWFRWLVSSLVVPLRSGGQERDGAP